MHSVGVMDDDVKRSCESTRAVDESTTHSINVDGDDDDGVCTTVDDGHEVNVGACRSYTMTENVHDDIVFLSSVAVHVTLCVPTVKR